MRLGRSLPASTGRPTAIAMVCGALALTVSVACGGGSAAQPAPTAAQAAPTVAVVASPARPPLASAVPSPAGTAASSAGAAATSTTTASATPGTSSGTGSDQTYEVQSGDTLLSIAEQFYGDVTKWRGIYDANKDVIGDNPDALKIGMKLKIPPKQS